MTSRRQALLRAQLRGLATVVLLVAGCTAFVVWHFLVDRQRLPRGGEWLVLGWLVLATILASGIPQLRVTDPQLLAVAEVAPPCRVLNLARVPKCWPVLARVPGLAWLLRPRLELTESALVLSHRWGRRSIAYRDILDVRASLEGVQLRLLGGDALFLQLGNASRGIGSSQFDDVARVTLETAYTALRHNEALAERIRAARRGSGSAYRVPALRVDPTPPASSRSDTFEQPDEVLEPLSQRSRAPGA